MSGDKPQKVLFKILERFKSSQLMMLLGGLFLLDLFIPDPIPFIDEAMLGLLTYLVYQMKTRSDGGASPADAPPKPPPKNVTPASS